jgi:hypothetical protein
MRNAEDAAYIEAGIFINLKFKPLLRLPNLENPM